MKAQPPPSAPSTPKAPDGIHLSLTQTRGAFRLSAELELPGQGITALFGHSGSGKTSLLRCLAGLDRADQACIRVAGDVWQDESQGLFIPTHQRRLGYVFQEANLFPHLSVRDNLLYGARRRTGASEEQVQETCALLGIAPLLDRSPLKLSGGERQRVAIARALLAQPALLLMDEPLASLDLTRRREILPYLESLNRNRRIPILYVTHSPEEVVRLADHLVLMQEGRVTACGPVAETLARLDLPETFQNDFGILIEGIVGAYDPDYRLQPLNFRGGCLLIPTAPRPQGSTLRVQVRAKDISLNLEQPRASSILNLIACRVVAEARPDGESHVLVQLDAKGTPLLASITRLSHDRLGLRPGLEVWAQIKAVAISN